MLFGRTLTKHACQGGGAGICWIGSRWQEAQDQLPPVAQIA